jgi:hypothetical protein
MEKLAFPCFNGNGHSPTEGMTLLDYFAGQVATSSACLEEYKKYDLETAASICYKMAARMIREREKYFIGQSMEDVPF